MPDKNQVKVALRIRPQLPREVAELCQVCTTVAGPQVWLGKDKAFTFDHVFDCQATQEEIYSTCVYGLVEGCFSGFNATVLAYGQTGSGKTYTMGTAGLQADGIIPGAVRQLFQEMEDRKRQSSHSTPDFDLSIQFIELYNEEIIDLLNPCKDLEDKTPSIKIHEDSSGQIYAAGLTSQTVKTPEEALKWLQSGSLARTTASTAMNCHSSRSHAIFSLFLRYTREVEGELETLSSKFHFVDLAGSERLKRTGATGDRAREGISINCGLLALGNVISALADQARKAAHVPYRDSKLTRLLQDSLGGNSQTLMIACISPCDRDFMETLNTLRYANRAKNIRNRLVVNQDKFSQTISALRAQIQQLEMELMEFKQGKRTVGNDGTDQFSDMFHENSMLQAENTNLRAKIKALQESLEYATNRNAQLLAQMAEQGITRETNGESRSEISELVQGYLKEIEELRAKLLEQEKLCNTLHRQHKRPASRLGELRSSLSTLLEEENGQNELGNGREEEDSSGSEEEEEGAGEEEELNADLAQLAFQIAEREGLIEQLEKSRRRLVALQQHYDKQLALLQTRIYETEQERDAVLAAQPKVNESKIAQLRQEYEGRLATLQTELRRMQMAQKQHQQQMRRIAQHERQLSQLRTELQAMKKSKVQLIGQLREAKEKHQAEQRTRRREMAQVLRREGQKESQLQAVRRDLAHKEMVLRRKVAEVSALRAAIKPKMSRKAAGKVFSPAVVESHWRNLQHEINQKVEALQTAEQEMERLLQERKALSPASPQLASLQASIAQAQATILRLQDGKDLRLSLTPEDCQVLLPKLVGLAITQGLEIGQLQGRDLPPPPSSVTPETEDCSCSSESPEQEETPLTSQELLRRARRKTSTSQQLQAILAEGAPKNLPLPSGETSPPNSPSLSRKSKDKNVFSRLTRGSGAPSHTSNRGEIRPNPIPKSRSSPLSCTHLVRGHSRAVLALAATDQWLFTASKDQSCRQWDLHSGQDVVSLSTLDLPVVAVKFQPSTQLLFTVVGHLVQAWDLRTDCAQPLHSISSSGQICSNPEVPQGELAVSDIVLNGQQLWLAAGNAVRLCDLRRFQSVGRLTAGPQSTVTCLAHHNSLLFAGTKDHYIKVFSTQHTKEGGPKATLDPPHYDGVSSLAAADDLLFSGSRDSCIKKWGVSSFSHMQSVNQAHRDWVLGLCLAPPGLLLSGCRRGVLKVWEPHSCQPLFQSRAHSSAINALAANSTAFFSASSDSTVGVWKLNGNSLPLPEVQEE